MNFFAVVEKSRILMGTMAPILYWLHVKREKATQLSGLNLYTLEVFEHGYIGTFFPDDKTSAVLVAGWCRNFVLYGIVQVFGKLCSFQSVKTFETLQKPRFLFLDLDVIVITVEHRRP